MTTATVTRPTITIKRCIPTPPAPAPQPAPPVSAPTEAPALLKIALHRLGKPRAITTHMLIGALPEHVIGYIRAKLFDKKRTDYVGALAACDYVPYAGSYHRNGHTTRRMEVIYVRADIPEDQRDATIAPLFDLLEQQAVRDAQEQVAFAVRAPA